MDSSIQQSLIAAANRWNSAHPNSPPIDPNLILGIALQESGGNPNVPPHPNYDKNGNIVSVDYGVMQLNNKSFPNAATLSPADNITTGTAYFGQLLHTFNGDIYQAISAYNSGAGNVQKSGITNPNYVNGVLQKSGTGGNYTSVTLDGTSVLSQSDAESTIVSPVAGAYSPLNNNSQNVDINALVPQIVIQEGLDAQAWYEDYGLLTGNPRLRGDVQPVSFQVMLHDNNNFLLSSRGESGAPVRVELNASMKSINWSMKHIYHHQRTRTAHHVTMWGMQADMIEGQCTTGVFMNQFGLTDYYSTRTVNDKLKNLVTSGEMFTNGNTSNPVKVNSGLGTDAPIDLSIFNNAATPVTVNGPGGQSITTVPGSGGNTNGFINSGESGFQKIMKSQGKNNSNFSQTDAFRVAAQDAFMEFLALFKMNGSVWFWNKLYSDNMGNTREWVGVQAWSPTLGMNAAQKNARNNDVVTRGGVLMSYRNFVYQGYFKTLQWTLSATQPYSWDFSFTFQVEKTVGQQYTLGTT